MMSRRSDSRGTRWGVLELINGFVFETIEANTSFIDTFFILFVFVVIVFVVVLFVKRRWNHEKGSLRIIEW